MNVFSSLAHGVKVAIVHIVELVKIFVVVNVSTSLKGLVSLGCILTKLNASLHSLGVALSLCVVYA